MGGALYPRPYVLVNTCQHIPKPMGEFVEFVGWLFVCANLFEKFCFGY